MTGEDAITATQRSSRSAFTLSNRLDLLIRGDSASCWEKKTVRRTVEMRRLDHQARADTVWHPPIVEPIARYW
jgi:hypothetical protein